MTNRKKEKSEEYLDSQQIMDKAIRELLGLTEEFPLTDEIRKKVTLLDLSGTSIRDCKLPRQ